ncbi:MAG: S-adenosylmethionine:tRNA ribosyltransferase-isomerase, partial [Thermoplasmata archaeon]|nr:S-adenosylmethionine:tRNA ribosyltransferase-isomerase [Thermoplasmata archaeon]
MNTDRTEEEYLLSSYNYHLPSELIAQDPADPRDSSRLMVCDLETDMIDHLRFRDIEGLLSEGDILVLNDSRVIPARIKGHKPTGGKAEVLFLNPLDNDGPLEALIKGRIKEGGVIIPDETTTGRVRERGSRGAGAGQIRIRAVRHINEGRFEVELQGVDALETFMERHGEMPVPPYIKKSLDQREKYQTVFSNEPGSIAAPTAGLHFTKDLLTRLKKKGIRILTITLHVSIGTFLPVRENDIRKHVMEPEYYILGPEMEEILGSGMRHGGTVRGEGGTPGTGENDRDELIAVGTTVVKALESVFSGPEGSLRTEGWSDLFI